MNRFLAIAALLLTIASNAFAQETAKLPEGVKRIVFIGDSITYFGGYVVNIETYLKSRYPDQTFEIYNFGMPSETVSGLNEPSRNTPEQRRPDLHTRLDKILEVAKPDLAFICYGMNDGIYLPLDNDRFDKFKEGMNWAHDTIAKSAKHIIHITPPVYDDLKATNDYNNVLAAYSKWLVDQKEKGWQVIDVHAPMTAYVEEHRKSDPKFALTKDGIHPTDLGHWVIAKTILENLGAKDITDATNADEAFEKSTGGLQLIKLIRERHDLLRNARMSSLGMWRNGMKKGIAIPDAEAKAADMTTQIEQIIHAPTTKP